MNIFLNIVFSATVIGIIIKGIFDYAYIKRDSKMSMITAERTKWREDIRNFVNSISICDDKDRILGEVNNLKVRINPLGYISKKNNEITLDTFLNDSYLWDSIYILENSNNLNDFNKEKNNLIMKLSILLKFDWERSKIEVLGKRITVNFINVISYYSLIIIYLLLCVFLSSKYNIREFNDIFKDDVFQQVLFFLFSMPVLFFNVQNYDKYKKKIYLICVCLLYFISICSFPFLLSLDFSKNLIYNLLLICLPFFLLVLLVFIPVYSDNAKKEKNYDKYILILNNNFYKN